VQGDVGPIKKGIIFSRYWCKSLIRSKGQVELMFKTALHATIAYLNVQNCSSCDNSLSLCNIHVKHKIEDSSSKPRIIAPFQANIESSTL